MQPVKKATKIFPPSNHNDGFTLLELIVVCVLIGIMLTLASPVLKDQAFSDPLKSTVRKVSLLVQGARATALSEQRFCTLHFNSSDKQFVSSLRTTKSSSPSSGLTEINSFTLPETVTLTEVQQGNDTTLVVDTFVLWIGPQGYTQPTALHFTNTTGDEMSIHIEPLLIATRIYDKHTPLGEE